MPIAAAAGALRRRDDTTAVARELTMLGQRRAATPPPSHRAPPPSFLPPPVALPSATAYLAVAPPQRSGTALPPPGSAPGWMAGPLHSDPAQRPAPLLGSPQPGARFTVVLDLDETLVYARPQVTKGAVWVRPATAELLQTLRSCRPAVETVAWTAADDRHASDVLRVLHGIVPGVISACITRDHPGTQWFNLNGYQKDVALLGREPGTVLLVDNTPDCIRPNEGASLIISDFDPSRADHRPGSGSGAMDGLRQFVQELAQHKRGTTVRDALAASAHVMKRQVVDAKGPLLWDTLALDDGAFTPPPQGNRDLAQPAISVRRGREEQPAGPGVRAASEPPAHRALPVPPPPRTPPPSRAHRHPPHNAADTGDAPLPPPRGGDPHPPHTTPPPRDVSTRLGAASRLSGSSAGLSSLGASVPSTRETSPSSDVPPYPSLSAVTAGLGGRSPYDTPPPRHQPAEDKSPQRRYRARNLPQGDALNGRTEPTPPQPLVGSPHRARRSGNTPPGDRASQLQQQQGSNPPSRSGSASGLMQLEEGMLVESRDLYGTWWRIRITGENGDGTFRATVYDNVRTDWHLVHPANCLPLGSALPYPPPTETSEQRPSPRTSGTTRDLHPGVGSTIGSVHARRASHLSRSTPQIHSVMCP